MNSSNLSLTGRGNAAKTPMSIAVMCMHWVKFALILHIRVCLVFK